MTTSAMSGTPVQASPIAATPAPATVVIRGWIQLPLSRELTLLQKSIDHWKVTHDLVERRLEASPYYFHTDIEVRDDSDYEWHRRYEFVLDSSAIIGILISKKITPTASERHCVLLSKKGNEPATKELKTMLSGLISLVQKHG